MLNKKEQDVSITATLTSESVNIPIDQMYQWSLVDPGGLGSRYYSSGYSFTSRDYRDSFRFETKREAQKALHHLNSALNKGGHSSTFNFKPFKLSTYMLEQIKEYFRDSVEE